MTHFCETCNFTTNIKGNYNRHLKTKRHLKKIEISTDNAPINTDNAPINTNNYKCDYCNTEYTRLSSLNRHQKKCVKQILLDKDKQLEEYKQQLKEKDEQIHTIFEDYSNK